MGWKTVAINSSDSATTVIIGGGFVGLFTALHLRHHQHAGPIVLVEPQANFVFKPMLYELLTEELPESVVCPSYEKLLANSGIDVVQARVADLQLAEKRLVLDSGQEQHYDYLVLAVGSVQGYLGAKGAEEYAFAFRSQTEAIALRDHLKACLDKSLTTADQAEKERLLTVAIVGAGPAGVDLAATLAELLPSWYVPMGGNLNDLKIYLVNHAPGILAGDANSGLKRCALEELQARTIPVTLKLGVGVKSVTPESLQFVETGEEELRHLNTSTTIWTAGTAVNPLLKTLKQQIPAEELDRHGQPLVTSTLQLPSFPQVFAAGDCVTVKDNPKPALAQIAYQQGAAIAKNLMAVHKGKPLVSPDPQLRGTLMKLGLNNGVANLFDRVRIQGKAGDLLRNATYLELLPTPLHNFKSTTQWLAEETIDRFHRPHAPTAQELKLAAMTPVQRREHQGIKAIAIIAPLIFIILLYLGFKTPERERTPFVPQPSPGVNQ